jgi:hypothetical protein
MEAGGKVSFEPRRRDSYRIEFHQIIRFQMQTLLLTSAKPLVTLAQADALDALFQRGRVIVPDMVVAEVKSLPEPWVSRVSQWLSDHQGRNLEVVATQEGEEYRVLLTVKPTARLVGRAEVAAGEVLEALLEQGKRDGDDIGDIGLVFDKGAKPFFFGPLPAEVKVMHADAFLG